jgi:hypothetical protein
MGEREGQGTAFATPLLGINLEACQIIELLTIAQILK